MPQPTRHVSLNAQRVADIIVARCARPKQFGTITYDQLAADPALAAIPGMRPMDGSWASHPLNRLFDELDTDDHRTQWPFLTACVVNGATDIPGQGFYTMLVRLRFGGRTELDEPSRRQLHRDELVALAARYQQP